MKCFLGISNFLEGTSSPSHSVVFLYFFALITEEGFLVSPCYSLELCIQILISFLFSFAFCLSQILKDDAVKVLHSIYQQIWKTQQWPQDWKRSVFIPIPKKGKAKEYSNYRIIALISHASKVMLKIVQARFQQFVNCELPGVQAGFRKGRRTRDQIANICWIIKKSKRVLEKYLFLLY